MSKMGVRGIIEHDGKYLLTRLVVADSFWCLPGGGVETDEDLITALKRELIEELGVEPDIGNLLFVHQLKTSAGSIDSTSFLFHVKNPEDYLNVDLSKTSHGKKEIIELKFQDVNKTHLLPSFLKTELIEMQASKYSLPTRVRITEFED